MIYTCTVSGDYGATFVSENVQQVLGYLPVEFIADSTFWAKNIHPDDAERVFADIADVTELNRHVNEYRFRHKDGTYRWMHDEIQLLFDVTGNSSEMIGFWLDITERKLVEEAKAKLEAKFQQTQKLESLGVLAGGIAHDFNNILNIILGYCYIINDDIDSGNGNKTHIKQIENSALRAADICRQMLAYAGRDSFVHTRINLWMLVDETVKMLQSAMKKNISIERDLKYDVPEIIGDSAQVQQVIMNLLINAAEAIGNANGIVKITLQKMSFSSDQIDIESVVTAINAGDYACLTITDNGCGMDAQTQQRIFEPFYTTKLTGRGLGMSAVLGIIKAHGGSLQLSSSPGDGTTFKAYFPLPASANIVECAPVVDLAHTAKASGTILLIDDEEGLRIIGSALLKAMGYSIITAENGSEGLEIYRTKSSAIDLILLDLIMPEIDGAQTFRLLREISPDIPIVICSGCRMSKGNITHAARLLGVSRPTIYRHLKENGENDNVVH